MIRLSCDGDCKEGICDNLSRLQSQVPDLATLRRQMIVRDKDRLGGIIAWGLGSERMWEDDR